MPFQANSNSQSSGVKAQGAISVLTSSTQIAAANSDRVELVIVNDGANAVWLAYGQAAVLNSGIRLNAAGGSHTTSAYSGAVFGIAITGTSVCGFIDV